MNYAAGSGVDARLSGFNRFCLRFAEPNGRNWTFWTPYLDMDGTDYEFFYVPARGLYEALIPAAGKPATQILAGVYWKNVTPDILRYGKLSGMIGYFAQTGSGGNAPSPGPCTRTRPPCGTYRVPTMTTTSRPPSNSARAVWT